MECPRCHNKNEEYFFTLNGKKYCRKCIAYKRIEISEKRQTKQKKYLPYCNHYHIDFTLSKKQQDLSKQLLMNYQNHENSLLLAVCGAGKTEIVFETIEYALKMGHRVCFCIPRKELVRELYERIQEAFDISIGVIYGGCCQNQDAQFIICTMHQLYRFENDIGFDLMIADEVDAFPFKGDPILNEMFQACCVGNFIKMSATEKATDQERVLLLNRRYHGYDLPVPSCFIMPSFLQKRVVKYLCLHNKNPLLIFVPSIKEVDLFIKYLSSAVSVAGVSSHCTQNKETLEKLKSGQIQVIVSTTLLERGITIEGVDVVIVHGENDIYNRGTLIQMAGRVGRKPQCPTGNVYILASQKTKDIKECIENIQFNNKIA